LNGHGTGRYATGPVRNDFIDTTISDVTADLNMKDENNVPTEQADFIEDINTCFTAHHFEPSQAEHSIPQTEQYTPYHFAQSAPQPMQSASQSESSLRSGKNKRKVEDTLDKLDQLIEVIKTQGEREELAKQDTRGNKLSEVLDQRLLIIFWDLYVMASSVITPEDVLETLMNDGTVDAMRLKIINQLKSNDDM
ncbi:hypothetical protein GIB67_001293, partial [Kingdonia uniflora]